MLEDFIEGKNSSWAIRWYASAFLNDKYTLYPGKSLVKNIGLDNSGTHSGKQEETLFNNTEFPLLDYSEIITVIEDGFAKAEVERYFRKVKFKSLFIFRLSRKLKETFWR